MESAGGVWDERKLLRAIQALYVDDNARVKFGGEKSELFVVHRRVRQGCTLSP